MNNKKYIPGIQLTIYKSRHIIILIRMKLTFTNKKEHKYCIFFIKALHQLSTFVKESQKPLYFGISSKQIKISPFLTDIHQNRVQCNCIITIKQDIYTLTQQLNERDDECKIYLINVFKILKSFVASQNKVNYIEMNFEQQNLSMSYTTQGDTIECCLQLKIDEIEDIPWPQNIQSTRQIFYEIIDIVNLKDRYLQNFKSHQQIQLWLQFLPKGISIKSFLEGKVRKEDKIDFKEQVQNKYDYLMIKNKLKNKVNINLKGLILFDHLNFCWKKKKIAQLKIVNIYDRFHQDELKMSYLLIKTNLEYGQIYKVIGCYICENMNEVNHEEITRQIQKEREVNKKNYLLKTQQNSQQVKKIVMNKYNQVDGQALIAEERFYQMKPFGKIEDGQETFTRKFRHRQ